MSLRYAPYPAYRDSGHSTLGDVPKDWTVRQLKRSVVDCANGIWGADPTGGPEDIVVIRVADFDRHKLGVLDGDYTRRRVTERERQRRLLRQGDLLLEKSGGGEKTQVGQVVLFRAAIAAVCSNFVAKMSANEGYASEYLNYSFSSLYAAGINSCSVKQNTGIQNLDSDAYLAEHWAFPPLSEQTQIAQFLNYETARIDVLIEKQQQLIELLKEKRQAVISHAVTKGLNSDAPLRDSGIEWLGKVPAHWEEVPLKAILSLKHGYAFDGDAFAESGEFVLMTPGNFREEGGFRPKVPEKFYTRQDFPKEFVLESGEMLVAMTEQGPGLLGCAITVPNTGRYLHNQRLGLVRGLDRKRVDPRYLFHVFNSPRYRAAVSVGATGVKVRHTSPARMLSVKVYLPPLVEQKQIAEFIDSRLATIESLHVKVNLTVELLQERRTALISAAVTGKIDVRNWRPPSSESEQAVS